MTAALNTWSAALLLVLCAPAGAATCDASHPEAFAAFLAPFSDDQRFAAERTTFPLRTVHWVYGANAAGKDAAEPVVRWTSKPQFMQWKTIGDLQKQSQLTHRVKTLSADEMDVALFREGSDVAMSYRFSRREGCWRFVQFEDRSL